MFRVIRGSTSGTPQTTSPGVDFRRVLHVGTQTITSISEDPSTALHKEAWKIEDGYSRAQ